MNEVLSSIRLLGVLVAAGVACAGDARADIYGYIDAQGAIGLMQVLP